MRANLNEDVGRYNDAIMDYEDAIESANDDRLVYALYHQIGFCYLSIGNNQKALDFYSYAIELKKTHPNSSNNPYTEGMNMGFMAGVPFKRMYNNRANALMNLGKLQEGIYDCNKAIEYDRNYSNPYIILFQIYAKLGNENAAIQNLLKSAELGNNNAVNILSQLQIK